ncbi:ACOT2 thioesterase, partial [Atractosteus spatula]|nr:ACOT2 thioesterase [Atractosteus spatula]
FILVSVPFCATSMSSRLQILPGPKCLFDELVTVKVEGLSAYQEVQLRARLTDQKNVIFQSSATYRADVSGKIDLSSSPALGGSFSGVEPMGLFWSLKPETPHKKLVKKDVLTPCLVHIELYSSGRQREMLAKEINERHFMAEGVRRLPIKHGRIHGTLFLPPGKNTFSCVLDLYTVGVGLSETRACLLANRGFVVFALALYGQGTPSNVSSLHLEYFEDALSFLSRRPEVGSPGIGILSISKSGDLALSMSSFLSGISATVCINGCNANVMFPLHYKDTVIPPLMFDANRAVLTESGALDVKHTIYNSMAPENRRTLIPIERADCRFLFVAAEDDRNWDSHFFAEQAAKRLTEYGKDNFEVVLYPGSGHYLDVPYMPHCFSSLHAANRKYVVWGGEPKSHGEAQVDLWGKIQAFFREHLDTASSFGKVKL